VGAIAFEPEGLEEPLRALAEERGWKAGDLFMAIRVAVTAASVESITNGASTPISRPLSGSSS